MDSPHRTGLAASLALLILFISSYYSSFASLAMHWIGRESDTYNYGFLVVACVLYLLYLQKDKFRAAAIQPFFWAVLPLVVFVLIWFTARLVDVQKAQFLVIPFIIISSITLCFGFNYLRIALLPLSILFFAMPIWDVLWPFLQDITTFVTHEVLLLIGKPVFVEEHTLRLPGGAFYIDTSCGGLRYLLVSAILSLMYSSMNELSLKQGAGLLLASLLLSFLANWIRVLIVVLIGDATQMQSSIVEDHENLGWLVYFLTVLVPLFFITKFIPVDPHSPIVDGVSDKKVITAETKMQLGAYVIALVVIVAGPVSSALLLQQDATDLPELTVPEPLAPWSSKYNLPIAESTEWQPISRNASQELRAEYTREAGIVELYLVHYRKQSQDAELINVGNQLFDEELWTSQNESLEILDPNLASGALSQINALEIVSRTGKHKLLWYWYQVGNRSTANTYMAKVFQIFGLLEGRTDATLVVLASDCEQECLQAGDLIHSFMTDMSSEILSSLQ